jgi:hypothetical protein
MEATAWEGILGGTRVVCNVYGQMAAVYDF